MELSLSFWSGELLRICAACQAGVCTQLILVTNRLRFVTLRGAVKTGGHAGPLSDLRKRSSRLRWLWRVAALHLLLTATVRADPGLNTDSPVGFFTNLASRLLQSELNLNLTRIQIWPTNQYTPAVHRLLQVTANIYDATTNRFNDDYPHLPTVFRPRFFNDNGTIYICGYVEETNSAFLSHTLRDLVDTNVANAVQPDDLILGVPLVIGAKKGLPNFNEFAAEPVIQITRKVELLKSAPGGANTIYQTNQMFIIGISNVFGAEFWNSYTNNYTRPVDIIATNFCSVLLTNDYTFTYNTNLVAGGQISIPSPGTNFWAAWNPKRQTPPATGPWSFLVPLRTNQIIIPDAVYRFGANVFETLTSTFEEPSGFAYPRWGLTITNRLLAIIKDRATGRIIDYVQLNGLGIVRDLTAEIAQLRTGIGFEGLWATNAPLGGGGKLSDQPGIIQQIEIAKGDVESGGNWQNYGIAQPAGATKAQAIAKFLAFFTPDHTATYVDPGTRTPYSATNYALAANAPFTPTSKRSVPITWQANDPLVHYMSGDMEYLERSGAAITWKPSAATNATLSNIGILNDRYRPWGGNPKVSGDILADPLAFQIVVKDPLVTSSDRWNFPDSEPLSLAMLARVHRGTPWQTLYLKSTTVADAVQARFMRADDWQKWTGNRNLYDAALTQPETDRGILDFFAASLVHTNDPHHLVSINEPDTNVWLAALDSIVALTNSMPDEMLYLYDDPQFDVVTMTSNSPQAAILAEGIRTVRAGQPNQRFNSLGALLAVSELSAASPWLNQSTDVQLQRGISDEAYEKIPTQLLLRVRPDSVGSIIETGGTVKIQFTGFDDYSYAVEASSNLVNWLPFGTNYPTNGVFEFTEPIAVESDRRFYRSVLLP